MIFFLLLLLSHLLLPSPSPRIAWKNNRHFATPTLISPRNDVWGKRTQHSPTLMTCHYQNMGSISDWSLKRRLFSQATPMMVWTDWLGIDFFEINIKVGWAGKKSVSVWTTDMIKNVASSKWPEDSTLSWQLLVLGTIVLFLFLYSLLPYSLHPVVAKSCIAHKKNLLTTSYVLPAIEELHQR